MSLIVKYKNELLRINPQKNRIEFSDNRGYTWIGRSGCLFCSGDGTFQDLLVVGNDLYLCTSKGFYYSNDGGRILIQYARGNFYSVMCDKNTLLAMTDRGLKRSLDGGRHWFGV